MRRRPTSLGHGYLLHCTGAPIPDFGGIWMRIRRDIDYSNDLHSASLAFAPQCDIRDLRRYVAFHLSFRSLTPSQVSLSTILFQSASNFARCSKVPIVVSTQANSSDCSVSRAPTLLLQYPSTYISFIETLLISFLTHGPIYTTTSDPSSQFRLPRGSRAPQVSLTWRCGDT